jgi:hypothetical protein
VSLQELSSASDFFGEYAIVTHSEAELAKLINRKGEVVKEAGSIVPYEKYERYIIDGELWDFGLNKITDGGVVSGFAYGFMNYEAEDEGVKIFSVIDSGGEEVKSCGKKDDDHKRHQGCKMQISEPIDEKTAVYGVFMVVGMFPLTALAAFPDLAFTTYYVRAYATNSAGTAYGENCSFTTATSDPLGAPQNLRYLAHDGAAELIWDAPAGAEGITHYELMRGNDLAQGRWDNIGGETTHTVSGLTNGVNTYFNLRAVDAVGPGEHVGFWAMANIPTVPGAPTSLAASGGDGWVRVSWHAPLNTGHRPIIGYRVSADNSAWSALVTGTSYYFPGLTNGVEYTFYVRAVNAVGAGESGSAKAAPRSTGGGYSGGGGSSVPAPAQTAVPDDDGKVSSDEKAVESAPPLAESAPESAANPFTDVSKTDWFYADVAFVHGRGLMTGVSSTEFAPQTSLTRAMLITILARSAGVDTTGGETWYGKAVEWGIANGITDGTNPDGDITREQLATMLYRYAVQELRIENGELRTGDAVQELRIENGEWRIANGDVSGYSDAGDISDWAYDAMQWAVGTGLITGCTATTLAPQGTATRAEAATLLKRYIESIG